MHIDSNNLNMLKEIIGEDLKEILNVFLESTPDSIMQLQNAINSNNLSKVQSCAHTIKGSAANVGANQLSLLASEIEQLAKLNDSSKLDTLLSQVITEKKAVKGELERYMAEF